MSHDLHCECHDEYEYLRANQQRKQEQWNEHYAALSRNMQDKIAKLKLEWAKRSPDTFAQWQSDKQSEMENTISWLKNPEPFH